MNVSDGYPALDLPRTQTVKDGTESECDAGFHQTLKEESRERFPPADTDKHTRLHTIIIYATLQIWAGGPLNTRA